LTWENVVDVGASSSSSPRQRRQKNVLMRHGVDGFSPSSWEPQEEGMMSTTTSFSLSKKPRFNCIQEKANTPEGDAD
jgi:hypothetical protein